MIREKQCSLCGGKVFFDTKTRKLKDAYSWGKMRIPRKGAKIIYEKKEILPVLGEVTVIDYDFHDSFEYIECLDCYKQKEITRGQVIPCPKAPAWERPCPKAPLSE